MKDPAFLFYSKDFYEGTRTMLPEERACYLDLLIYQHQNEFIPDDINRLSMYCSGCSRETILNVLNQKFTKMVNQTVNVWVNHRLENEKKNRAENKPKKIASATLAGLISSNNLKKVEIVTLKKNFEIADFIYDNDNNIKEIEEIKKDIKEWFYKMVNQTVNNIANANANANANEDINNKHEIGKEKIFDFKESLLELGLKAKLVDEWCQIRHLKKLTNTETAFKKFLTEYQKTDKEINSLFENYIIPKSWGGFEASWLKDKTVKEETKIIKISKENY